MTAVLLVGVGRAPGKSALAAALGRRLQQEGRRLGYYAPSFDGSSGALAEAALIRQVLRLGEILAQLTPLVGAWPVAQNDAAAVAEQIEAGYAAVAAGKDVVLVEAPGSLGAPDGDAAIALLADRIRPHRSRPIFSLRNARILQRQGIAAPL